VYRNAKVTLKRYTNQTQDIVQGPLVDAGTREPIWRHKTLESDGMTAVGEKVLTKQVMVNRHVPAVTHSTLDPDSSTAGAAGIGVGGGAAGGGAVSHKESPLSYKGSLPSYVEKVGLFEYVFFRAFPV
jgi:DNA-directed RNA polymerase III subunit RPC2